jgi:DNA-binding transcriptional LysR family regulator
MDLRQLRYFVAVAESHGFRRAAERVFIAQPALGRQITALEKELGAVLLDRSSGGAVLTDAGRAFLERAKAILQAVGSAAQEAQAIAEGLSGSFKLGYTDEFMYGHLARRLARFVGAKNSIQLELDFGYTTDLTQKLAEGALDAVLGVLPVPSHLVKLQALKLARAPLKLIVPTQHLLAKRSQVTLRECGQEVFIVARATPPSGYSLAVAECLRRANVTPRTITNIFPSDMMINLVAAGAGVSLMTEYSASFQKRGVIAVPLVDSKAYIELGLVLPPDPSPIALRFKDWMTEEKYFSST